MWFVSFLVLCYGQADTVSLMMRRVYDIGGRDMTTVLLINSKPWSCTANNILTGTSGDRCSVYLNGRILVACTVTVGCFGLSVIMLFVV